MLRNKQSSTLVNFSRLCADVFCILYALAQFLFVFRHRPIQ